MNRTAASHPAGPQAWLQYLSLFSSLSTLICCALPSLLVLLGLGATGATVLSAVPWLVLLSQHKGWVFTIAGALIAFDFAYVYAISPRLRASSGGTLCAPDNPSCEKSARLSKIILWISAGVYSVGALTAFGLGPFLLWWDSQH